MQPPVVAPSKESPMQSDKPLGALQEESKEPRQDSKDLLNLRERLKAFNFEVKPEPCQMSCKCLFVALTT